MHSSPPYDCLRARPLLSKMLRQLEQFRAFFGDPREGDGCGNSVFGLWGVVRVWGLERLWI